MTASSAGSGGVLWVSLAQEMSGAEHSLLELVAGLAGPHTIAVPEGAFARRLQAGPARVEVLPAWQPTLRGGPWQWVATLPALARLVHRLGAATARHKAKVLVGNGLRAGMAATMARTGLPVVWALRDLWPEGMALTAASALARRATLVANSQFIAEGYRRLMPPGTSVHAIHPGVSWREPDPGLRAGLGLGPSTSVCAVVGQVAPWKGQHRALAVARLLRRRRGDLRLVFVGEPKFRPENRRYWDALRADAQADGGLTVFLGERSDLHRLYPDMDVLLVPSEGEPFGRVAAEALGYGVPVVASRSGGLPEVVTNAARGRLVAVDDLSAWAAAVESLLAARFRLEPRERDAVRQSYGTAAIAREWEALLGSIEGRSMPCAV